MSKHKWSMRLDFEEHPGGGGEMVFYVKTSRTEGEWSECKRAVVPDGVELKTYTAFGEMAHFAMGDEEVFWQDLFRREVPGLYEGQRGALKAGRDGASFDVEKR